MMVVRFIADKTTLVSNWRGNAGTCIARAILLEFCLLLVIAY